MIGPGALGSRGVTGVSLAQGLALILPCVVIVAIDPTRYAVLLAVALITALAWEAVFAALRRHGASAHGMTTALIVSVLIPPDLALWQLILVMSLGVILGELVFGGRGFGFVSPGTVTLTSLVVSFPQVQLPPPSETVAVATLPGAIVLVVLGLISWRVLLATVLTAAAALTLGGHAFDPAALAVAISFGLVFLICDPTSAAVTNPGRWIYGAFAGGLIVLFSGGPTVTSEAMVFTALLIGVFAPLIDHLVVLLHAARRKRRHA